MATPVRSSKRCGTFEGGTIQFVEVAVDNSPHLGLKTD